VNLVDQDDFKDHSVLGKQATLRLPPREFRLAFTLEKIFLPLHLAASVQGKSGPARAGLAVHITAPTIHPGFNAPLTLELYNHGPWELELFPEDAICQVVYYRLCTPVPIEIARRLGTYLNQKVPFPSRKR
jgi:deoxycytidine triphosphate deaminase